MCDYVAMIVVVVQFCRLFLVSFQPVCVFMFCCCVMLSSRFCVGWCVRVCGPSWLQTSHNFRCVMFVYMTIRQLVLLHWYFSDVVFTVLVCFN